MASGYTLPSTTPTFAEGGAVVSAAPSSCTGPDGRRLLERLVASPWAKCPRTTTAFIRTSGRIYKVTHGTAQAAPPIKT